MFKLNDKTIRIDQDLVIGEGDDAITIPAGSLQDAATRAQFGITEEPDPVRPDERYYYVTQNADGSLTATPKPAAQVLDMLWWQIKAHRDQRQEAGCLAGTDWFHNDVKSRTQWERMANRSASAADADPYLVAGQQVQWKTMAGTFVPLTAGKIRQVVTAFEIQEATTFMRAEQHRAALAVMTDVELMAAYDWRAGWPAVYEVAP